jgi:hypothetical protein
MRSGYRIETHCHTATVSPCGRLSPERLVQEYARAGYSGIIVTDHLTERLPLLSRIRTWPDRVRRFFAGYRAAVSAGAELGVSVFPGFELSFPNLSGSDFLVFGINEELLADMPDPFELGPAGFREVVRSAGALVFQAHPFRKHRPVDPAFLDGVEVSNGNPRHDSQNHLAAAFARRHGLLASSGSDTHRLEDVARGGILVREMPASVKELVSVWKTTPHDIVLLDPVSASRRA